MIYSNLDVTERSKSLNSPTYSTFFKNSTTATNNQLVSIRLQTLPYGPGQEKSSGNSPPLNPSGFSEINQCPASTLSSCQFGKNFLINGIDLSRIYPLRVPFTNNDGPSKLTSWDML